MRTRGTLIRLTALAALGSVALLAAPAAAFAKTASPLVSATFWYTVDYQREEQQLPTGTVTVETPNEFCPGPGNGFGAPEQTCARGALPVEVRNGDYKKPAKASAVGFDLSLIPVGSKVKDFTVTFIESETRCFDEDDDGRTDRCQNTDARNAGDVKLQACLVTGFLAPGESRPFNEGPGFDCSGAPTATRKEVKNDDKKDPQDPDADHEWTFDLTSFASDWVADFSITTAIYLMPKKPKDAGSTDSFRVVFTGPPVEDQIRTKLVFDPAELADLGDFGDLGESTGGDLGSGGTGTATFGGSTGTTTFGTGSTGTTGDFAADTGTTAPGTGAAGGEDPVDAGDQEPALATGPKQDVEDLPGYVWLALLGGLVAFSLVRSVVLESAAGIRPNGVLAQIRRVNAARRGTTIETAAGSTGGVASVMEGLKSLGQGINSGLSKLSFRRRA